jgi:branched-chain amino acid transport system permease protein
VIVCVTAAFAIVPLATDNASLRESLIIVAVAVSLASNVNLMIGYTGYVNFGNVVSYGLGGYLGLYLTTVRGWPLVAAAIGAGVAVSFSTLLFGMLILRLRGAYFSLATIGILEAVRAFVSNFDPWGRTSGLYVSMDAYQPLGGPMRAVWISYLMVIAVMGVSLLSSLFIKNSKFGLGLFAIREDEDAAIVLGVNATLYKAVVYSVSAFLPAVTGALIYFKNGMIDPGGAFDLTLSIEAIVMMLLGGRGTVTGAAIGAALYEQIRGYLLTSETLSNFHLVIAGGLLLIIVLFAPEGLIGGFYRLVPRARRVLE